jgi:hypothetical protein
MRKQQLRIRARVDGRGRRWRIGDIADGGSEACL